MPEVGVAQLRRDLKRWLERAQAGEEVTVTDRGRPVARLIGADAPDSLGQLLSEGRIARPRRSRPSANTVPRIRGHDGASTYVVQERRGRRE